MPKAKQERHIYEYRNGTFSYAAPDNVKDAVAVHNLSTHVFRASLEVVGGNEGKVYLRDLETGGYYHMGIKHFVSMLKQSVVRNGMVTALWGWSYHPSMVSLLFREQLDE